MNIESAANIAIVLMIIQCLIIIVITQKNKESFEGKNGLEYPRAIHALSTKKPIAALTIKICYALCPIELAILYFIRG